MVLMMILSTKCLKVSIHKSTHSEQPCCFHLFIWNYVCGQMPKVFIQLILTPKEHQMSYIETSPIMHNMNNFVFLYFSYRPSFVAKGCYFYPILFHPLGPNIMTSNSGASNSVPQVSGPQNSWLYKLRP